MSMTKTNILRPIRSTFYFTVVLACFGIFPLHGNPDEFLNEYYEPLWPGGKAAFEYIYSSTASRALLTGASVVVPLPDPTVLPWKYVVAAGDHVHGATYVGATEYHDFVAKVIDGVTQWVRIGEWKDIPVGDSVIHYATHVTSASSGIRIDGLLTDAEKSFAEVISGEIGGVGFAKRHWHVFSSIGEATRNDSFRFYDPYTWFEPGMWVVAHVKVKRPTP